MTDSTVSRRSFLGTMAKGGAAAAAAPLVVPRRVLGGPGYQAPSDTVNIAGIGVGGVGEGNLGNVATPAGESSANGPSENVVALADTDHNYASDVFEKYPDAATYYDYRRMLDEMGSEIDGVIIATPDHTHAKITADAMQRGLHVYTQKPLTWSVGEARYLRRLAAETDVVTQMGNQGHSSDDARLVNEYIRSGAIGAVDTIHVWTNRPIWPQGMEMPDTIQRVPDQMRWDLFLGPAPDEPYHEDFHPFSWRGWVDWGTGALGDMGAHLVDHPFWALELGAPTTIQTRSTPFNGASWPRASMTHFQFPERGDQPAVTMKWYDGGMMPERPDAIPEEESLTPGGGVLFVGEDGYLMHETYGSNPRLFPTELAEDLDTPPQMFDRVEDENHEMNWVRAMKGQAEATSPFDYATRLTETMLLGIVSLRADTRKLEWDGEAGEVTNVPEANQYLSRRNPRQPWMLSEVQSMVGSAAQQ
jgi:predicted dehydrogenase